MNGYITNSSIGVYGRFCNQAYQVCAVFGIARKNGLIPVFPQWQNKDHRDRFGSTEDIDLYKHFVNPLPSLPEGVPFTEKPIQWGYHDVRLPGGNWNLSGHFQSTKYFEHCIDEIRWHFRMKDEPEQNEYVAIHRRAGDYCGGYHPRLDMRYYGPAMEQFPGAKFLVFSDSLDEAKQMFGDTVEYSEGRDYIEDFKLMKRCKDFIIGNSTFSSMAAVLGEHPEKRVVAPAPWFGPKYTGITGDDIYNDDWTIIRWE